MITSFDDRPDYGFSLGLYESYDDGLTGVDGLGMGAGSMFRLLLIVLLKTLLLLSFLINLPCVRSPLYDPALFMDLASELTDGS